MTSLVGGYLFWMFSALVFAFGTQNIKSATYYWFCFFSNFMKMVVLELFKRKSTGTNASLPRLLPFLKTEAIKPLHCQVWKPSGMCCLSFLEFLLLVSEK